jgi:hypothetical protein
LASIDDFLTARRAADAALFFASDPDLDEALRYVIGNFKTKIRAFDFNDGSNFLERFLSLND